MNPTDHIQIVTFQLAGLEPDAYRAHVEASAPAFTEIRGLRAKAWLANPGIAHVTTRDFGILERPTEITRRR